MWSGGFAGPGLDVSLCGLLPCGLNRNPHKNWSSCTSGKKRFRQALQECSTGCCCTVSAAIICLKCGADFHYTASIPGIPGRQGWITGKPEWGGPTAVTGGRKGKSPEPEHLSDLQSPTFICPRRVFTSISSTLVYLNLFT